MKTEAEEEQEQEETVAVSEYQRVVDELEVLREKLDRIREIVG